MATVRQYLRTAAVLLATLGLAVLTSVSCRALAPAAAAAAPAAARSLAAPARSLPPRAASSATAAPTAAPTAPRRDTAIGSRLCAGHRMQAAVDEGSAPGGCAPGAGSGGQPLQHRARTGSSCGPAAPEAAAAGPPVARPLPRDQLPGLLRV